MSEQEAGRPEAESESWWEKGLGVAGLGHAGTEANAVGEAAEGFHTIRGGAAALAATEGAELEEGAVGTGSLLAPLALASGINELINGKTPQAKIGGALETTSGAVGTAGLVGEGLTAAGATGAGGALTGAAAAAAPVAAVAGAGAAGLKLGEMGNNFASEHDLLGENADGTHRNWSDMASDWGVSAHDAVGDGILGDVAGFGATAAGSIVGAAGAAVTGVAELGEDIGSGIASVGSSIGHGISSLFSW